MKFKLNNVRSAFNAYFEPKAVNAGDKPAYSGAFLIPKDHPQLKDLEKAIAATADEKWGAKGHSSLFL